MLSAVADSRPPRMTMAIGVCSSLPCSPPPSASGMSASPAVRAVMRIGDSRSRDPRTTASRKGTSSSNRLPVMRHQENAVARRDPEERHEAHLSYRISDTSRRITWRLERAHEERAGGVFGVKGSFLFTPLRGLPRFKALLRKMNLG